MEQDDIKVSKFAILSESGKVFIRMILCYLREAGHQVDIFNDQESAFKSIEKYSYSLLFVDTDMPGLDVLSMLSYSQHIHPETSMVIITANEKMNTAMEALKMGAADILVKPIDIFYLDAALEKSIRLNKLVIENKCLKMEVRRLNSTLSY